MKVTLWGTRGSLATPGPETSLYGGNTSCVQVTGNDGTQLVLDGGSGLLRLGATLPAGLRRIDVFLSHLHMDHIQGLGFFKPLYNPNMEVHLWGPASTTMDLRARLIRYLSPPLFPVLLRDLPCKLHIHQVPCKAAQIGEFLVHSHRVCHPGPTIGYRIESPGCSMAYIPDHEPALAGFTKDQAPQWISGYDCAKGVDMLIHDAQYTNEEYRTRVGWGHSTLQHVFDFAEVCKVKRLVPFHHDPAHSDQYLDKLFTESLEGVSLNYEVTPAKEGLTFSI